MGSASDAEVISSASSPSAAVGTLFDEHFDVIYGFLARRVGPPLAEKLATAS